MSMLVDAFQGAGVPLAGDPITSFQNVSGLELRTGTVVNNCQPAVGDIVKVRFIATNCGAGLLELIPLLPAERETPRENVTTLMPGESMEFAVFRSWQTPGEHQLAFVLEARLPGKPFARLVYPMVPVHVRNPEVNKRIHWLARLRAHTSHSPG